jgi:tetrahydromethanopterin S-methyltransferase subunit A
MNRLTAACSPDVAIAGTMFTESLGIERLLTNVLASPHITTLLVCGADSRQRIGHRPGQSLLSFAAHGVDELAHIIGAEGRAPF